MVAYLECLARLPEGILSSEVRHHIEAIELVAGPIRGNVGRMAVFEGLERLKLVRCSDIDGDEIHPSPGAHRLRARGRLRCASARGGRVTRVARSARHARLFDHVDGLAEIESLQELDLSWGLSWSSVSGIAHLPRLRKRSIRHEGRPRARGRQTFPYSRLDQPNSGCPARRPCLGTRRGGGRTLPAQDSSQAPPLTRFLPQLTSTSWTPAAPGEYLSNREESLSTILDVIACLGTNVENDARPAFEPRSLR